MFCLCAIFTTSDPGSATPGQPASESNPIEFPAKQSSKKEGISKGSVNLFKLYRFKLLVLQIIISFDSQF